MPELPEVETIARGLRSRIAGRTIAAVDVFWPGAIDAASRPLDSLAGDSVGEVDRLGKFLLVRLTSGRTLAVHLRMTGRLLFAARPLELPYTRAVVRFTDASALIFTDVRKFGRLRLIEGDPQADLKVGVDALTGRLDAAVLRELLRGRMTPIKLWLLDQRRVAGVGNIYASETLYEARIRPKRRAAKLTAADRERLLAALRKVLKKAIRHRGSSVDDYVDAEGKRGGFQNLLAVYARAGEPCRRCRTPIQRTVLGQRATFFCPGCQQ